MKFLLIAYDYPPTPSPQSLRWAYLTRELSLAGHEVHVLTADVAAFGPGGLPAVPESVRVHRVFPGPLAAFVARTSRAVRDRVTRDDAGSPGEGADPGSSRVRKPSFLRRVSALLGVPVRLLSRRIFGVPLNLKGLAVESAKRVWGWALFPDYRAEWSPWASRAMHRILDEARPDVVVTSHEPANSIPLGLAATRRGFKWIADLGDPVRASYTPSRWVGHALALEAAVWSKADLITVTSAGTRDLLSARHGGARLGCEVLTQGYDARLAAAGGDADCPVEFRADQLELLYTGSFYRFRRIGRLLDAVLRTPNVRLSIASANAPSELEDAGKMHPDSIRMLGFLPHLSALAAQRACDVLINLANEDSVQVPGKLYEYLGSGRPILHVGDSVDDAAVELLRSTGAGVCEPGHGDGLSRRLADWSRLKREGSRPQMPVQTADVQDYSWQSLAAQLASWSQPLAQP